MVHDLKNAIDSLGKALQGVEKMKDDLAKNATPEQLNEVDDMLRTGQYEGLAKEAKTKFESLKKKYADIH